MALFSFLICAEVRGSVKTSVFATAADGAVSGGVSTVAGDGSVMAARVCDEVCCKVTLMEWIWTATVWASNWH